jgi:hypothetical protein
MMKLAKIYYNLAPFMSAFINRNDLFLIRVSINFRTLKLYQNLNIFTEVIYLLEFILWAS